MIDYVYIYILDDYRIILVYDGKKGSIDSDGILCDKYGEPGVDHQIWETCLFAGLFACSLTLFDSRCAMLEMLLPEHALTLLMIFDVFFKTRCALQKR